MVFENARLMNKGRTRAEFTPGALLEGSSEIAVLEAQEPARMEELKQRALEAVEKEKQEKADKLAEHNQRLMDIYNSGRSYEGTFQKKKSQIPFRITFSGKNTKIKFLETNEIFGIKDPEIFQSTSTLIFFIGGRPEVASWGKIHRWDMTLDNLAETFSGVYSVQNGRNKYKLSVNL